MRKMRLWQCCLVMAICFFNNQSVLRSEDSSEVFLKKYALAESFELGLEFDFSQPSRDEFDSIQKYFFTVAHTVNENSTWRFKIGSLAADYVDTKRNDADAGTLKETPLSLSLITGLNRSSSLKPYIGAGVSYLRYISFDGDSALYEKFKARNTWGYHLVGGVKYISARNITLMLDISMENLEPFTLKDRAMVLPRRKVNLSNTAVGLNLALRF